MKNPALYIFLLFFIFLYGCNQNTGSNNTQAPGINSTSQCYVSSTGSDSASLFINEQYGKITGGLKMYFDGKDNLSGTIAGTFRGDTLFVDYTFRAGSNPAYLRNPLAFLKKDGKLYQGYGQITTSYGRADFKTGVPITFDKGFVFTKGDCK